MVEQVMGYANMTGHPVYRYEAERVMDAYFDLRCVQFAEPRPPGGRAWAAANGR